MDNILANFKRDLEDKGFVHIPGHQYYALLLHFGALPRDLQKIEDGHIHKHVGQDREETMAFRQVAFHRVLLTETDNEAQDEANGEGTNVCGGTSMSMTFTNIRQNFEFAHLCTEVLSITIKCYP